MTAIPEAKLAREAEMSYGMLALATDYDCWHESEEDVSVEAVMTVLKNNSAMAQKIVSQVIKSAPKTSAAPELSVLAHAVMTSPELIPEQTKKNLQVISGS